VKKLGALLAVLTVGMIPNAHADQPTQPLAATVNVTAACEISATEIPENSLELVTEALRTSGPVRKRCHKRAVWRIEVDGVNDIAINESNAVTQGQINRVLPDSVQTVNRGRVKSRSVRMTVNF
jgi:hypothetical protein